MDVRSLRDDPRHNMICMPVISEGITAHLTFAIGGIPKQRSIKR